MYPALPPQDGPFWWCTFVPLYLRAVQCYKPVILDLPLRVSPGYALPCRARSSEGARALGGGWGHWWWALSHLHGRHRWADTEVEGQSGAPSQVGHALLQLAVVGVHTTGRKKKSPICHPEAHTERLDTICAHASVRPPVEVGCCPWWRVCPPCVGGCSVSPLGSPIYEDRCCCFLWSCDATPAFKWTFCST